MINTIQYTIFLSMGKGMGEKGWSQIPWLSKKQVRDLDRIGYSGKLNRKRISISEYLKKIFNSDKKELTCYKSKWDNGDFSEEYTIIASEYIEDK